MGKFQFNLDALEEKEGTKLYNYVLKCVKNKQAKIDPLYETLSLEQLVNIV
jgi:hypothetical protein